jgi:hypothetical protein
MPKFTVFYLMLTNEQVAEINAKGWDCPLGKAYLDVKFIGERNLHPAMEADLYVKMAEIEADNCEQVWTALQNDVHIGKDYAPQVKILMRRPNRSMDVGDLIWVDEPAEGGPLAICSSIGFEAIEDPDVRAYIEGKL